jgi:two-component system, OmpR family, lantibiotic biosynthesis response regulator NisR/SpaR
MATQKPERAGRVLVVDDEDGILAFVRDALEDEGYEVLTAPSGEEAVRIVRRKRPDLILLDVQLPGADGWEVLNQLRAAAGPQAPVVVMTAGYNDQDHALSTGAQGYLGKPFDVEDLISTVEAHIGLEMEGATEISRVAETAG